MMPHNPWGSSARRPCARWHPPAIGGQSHSCRVLITFMLRQAQHERSHGLATTRKFAFSLVMPPTQPFDRSFTKSHPHRSPGASQSANLTVRLEPVERWTGTPQLVPIRSYFDRLSTNGATASSPHESLHSASQCPPPLNRSTGASRYTNLTVRLEPVERWTGTPQLVPIRSYFDRLSTNGATASSPHESLHSASQCPHSTVRPEHHKTPSLPFAWSLTIHQPYRSP